MSPKLRGGSPGGVGPSSAGAKVPPDAAGPASDRVQVPRADAGPPLTAGQLQFVRTVAEREARRLDIAEGQAALLADATVGALTAPTVS